MCDRSRDSNMGCGKWGLLIVNVLIWCPCSFSFSMVNLGEVGAFYLWGEGVSNAHHHQQAHWYVNDDCNIRLLSQYSSVAASPPPLTIFGSQALLRMSPPLPPRGWTIKTGSISARECSVVWSEVHRSCVFQDCKIEVIARKLTLHLVSNGQPSFSYIRYDHVDVVSSWDLT